MSSLRRRLLGTPSTSPSRDATPEPHPPEKVRLVPVAKLHKHKTHKRRNGFIFGLGGLFGILVAGFFANQQQVISLDGMLDLNLESLLDVIPAGIIRDAKDLTVCELLYLFSSERS